MADILLFLTVFANEKYMKYRKDVSQQEWIRLFNVILKQYLFYGGRSPPFNLEFSRKFKIGGKQLMEGNHPKRRKDKYNPYKIYEKDGHFFVSFKDGQALCHEFEISRPLYDVFNSYELEDLVYLNVLDRHIEQSEVWENTLNIRALQKPESVEEIVLRKIQIKDLHIAIHTLPEMQKRRLLLYYFEHLTYEQIAEREGCSKVAVKYTIDKALAALKKILK